MNSPANALAKTEGASSPAIEGSDLNVFAGDPDFMLSLARGMLVLHAFADAREKLTIARIAAETGLTRSTVRRCLYTFVKLGYFEVQGSQFVPRVNLLMLASAYKGAGGLEAALQPLLDDLRNRLGATIGLGVKDGEDVYYAAVSKSLNTLSFVASVGRRVPVYCTALGRVFLADLPPQDLDAYIKATKVVAHTPFATADRATLKEMIEKARVDGYAVAAQELELGVRAIAVPIRPGGGRTVAALLAAGEMSQMPDEALQTLFLPEMLRTAREIALLWKSL